jgi:hypothetical protein
MADAEETWPDRDGPQNPALQIGSLHRWGCELEFEIPAGAAVYDIQGREHRLLAPVRVRAAQPCTVWEGRTAEGTPEDAAWPASDYGDGRIVNGIPANFVRLEDLPSGERRRVAMLTVSEEEIPGWLRDRLAVPAGGGDKDG